MKIHVFYRHTNINKATLTDRPDWFSHKKCINNLMKTILTSPFRDKIFLNFIFDGTEQDLKLDECYRTIIDNELGININVSIINGGSQKKAWKKSLTLVKGNIDKKIISDDDLVYFLENDYLHTEEWLNCLFELAMSDIKWDYVTLYDHADKYPNYCIHPDAKKNLKIRSEIYCSGSRHWRTTPSTCGTFLINRNTFIKDYWLLKKGLYDYKLFFILSKIFRKKILSPMPSLSTHCMTSLLAPTINWGAYVDE